MKLVPINPSIIVTSIKNNERKQYIELENNEKPTLETQYLKREN
jgi:hypothetical protein